MKTKIAAKLRVALLCLYFATICLSLSYGQGNEPTDNHIPKVIRDGKTGRWNPGGSDPTGPLTTIVKWPGWDYTTWQSKVGNKLIKIPENGEANIFRDQYLAIITNLDPSSLAHNPDIPGWRECSRSGIRAFGCSV